MFQQNYYSKFTAFYLMIYKINTHNTKQGEHAKSEA